MVSSNEVSPSVDLIIGAIGILLGGALALDLKKISTTLLQNGTGFTPWGRRRGPWQGPNPVRFVGWGFLVVGLITLILGLVRII
jgi:hypothetical protein